MKTPATNPEPKVRPAVKIFVAVTGLLCVGIIAVHVWHGGRPAPASIADPNAMDPASQAQRTQAVPASQRSASATGTHARTPGVTPAPAFQVEPLPEARKWVQGLIFLDANDGPLTDERAAVWKENFQRMIQQGDWAIPAINEFLAQNADVAYNGEDAKKLGYSSARMAMLDALMQIASPQAKTALATVLRDTPDPSEIAQVTQYMEKSDPGIYQPDELAAARRVLTTAAGGSLPGVDVAPLFQVLQQYGHGDVVADLTGNAGQWNYYASIALAQLPEQAGVPSLIQLATNPGAGDSNARTPALELLAEVAPQSGDAQDTLVEQARQGKLSASDWTALAPFLAGNQMVYQNAAFGSQLGAANPNDVRGTFIPASNQSFYTAPVTAPTADQIKFIDRLLSVTADPMGTQVLTQAKMILENRLGLANNTSSSAN